MHSISMKSIFFFSVIWAAALVASCTVQRAENMPFESSEPALTTAPAERQPVLVELFTSEGCSSCPPADRQLAFLENNQPVAGAEVVTLAFHVDYWNRLGWTDKYSSPQFSERQNSYVQRMGLDSSYTPQMVVDGQFEFVGSDARKASDALAKAATNLKSRVDIRISANSVETQIGPISQHQAATVYLAVAEDGIVTDVKSCENGGRKLPHVSVVRKLDVIGKITASDINFRVSTKLPTDPGWKSENVKYIVFAQEDTTGKVIAVGKTDASK